MEAGGSQGRVNPNTFSLTELSLLMRILDRIHLPEIYYSAESTSIENVFRQKGGQVLASIGLSENDRMVIDFRLKIRAVMNYFTQILENYEMELIRNYHQTVDRGTKLRFINKRIDNYREIFSPEVETELLGLEDLLKISILQYIEALDKYEVFANNFHDMLENKAFGRIYGDLNWKKLCETDSLEITNVEFAQFAPFLIQGPNNTYNLYNLFYSNYVQNNDNNLKGRLEQYYINPQLLTRITEQLNNETLGYHRELREIHGVPPQTRELHIPYNQPLPTVDEQEAVEILAAISQQASGRRRLRNGNGGNGQHGGGRGRHE
uniref:Uncharacterized protein n=1 Tax=Meloidogyne javanica TaxID=6303 RepID=A0A915M0F0_MELJA